MINSIAFILKEPYHTVCGWKNIYIYSFSYASEKQEKQEMVNFKVIVTILLSVSYNALYEKVLNKESKGR